MRGATRDVEQRAAQRLDISIHTPHAGSDRLCPLIYKLDSISIHTPHAGSDSLEVSGGPAM